jgi:HSP20 family protein
MTEKEKKELEARGKKPIEKAEGEPTREGTFYVPDVDILDGSDGITLLADLPGVKKENIDIDVRDGVLTLTATVDPVPERFNPVYREYDIGGFTRRFTLGERVDQGKINAKLDNGVLTLTLPKAEEAKPRKIEIK